MILFLRTCHSKVKKYDKMQQPAAGKTMDKNKFFDLLEIFIAEFIGTGFMLFFGCMGLQQSTHDQELQLNMLKVGFVFGTVIAMIVLMFGHISEAHFNPAVSMASCILGRTKPLVTVMYMIAQFSGGIAGYLLLQLITPVALFEKSVTSSPTGCCCIPNESMSAFQSFLVEYMSTSVIIFCVCAIWDPRNTNHESIPVAIGFVIVGLAMIEAPYTGAGLNPARTFAPALIKNVWTYHWVYMFGPLLAGITIPIFYQACFMGKIFGIVYRVHKPKDAPKSNDENETSMISYQ